MTLLRVAHIWSNEDKKADYLSCQVWSCTENHFFWLKHLICCWLLHFYDHCLWSSMTHINGKASFFGKRFLSLMLGCYWTWLLFEKKKKTLHFVSVCSNPLGLPLLSGNIYHVSLETSSKPVRNCNIFRIYWVPEHHILLYLQRRWITYWKI